MLPIPAPANSLLSSILVPVVVAALKDQALVGPCSSNIHFPHTHQFTRLQDGVGKVTMCDTVVSLLTLYVVSFDPAEIGLGS